jgi:5-formyltetrahydrofolate cyclo-ligase
VSRALPADKAALRRAARALRAGIGEAAARRAAAALAARFAATFSGRSDGALRHGMALGGYWPVHGEIDVRPILERHRDAGGITALPAVLRPAAPLVFRRWRGGALTAEDALGLPVPDGEAVEPDMLLVPLLAFDRAGHRLGYGGGYYDRTIAALRAGRSVLAIGVGFAAQEVARVPAGAEDARLDWVVTEAFAFPVEAA